MEFDDLTTRQQQAARNLERALARCVRWGLGVAAMDGLPYVSPNPDAGPDIEEWVLLDVDGLSIDGGGW